MKIQGTHVEIKTVDQHRVVFRKDLIAAVEEIPKSARSEGQLKIYSGGFSFGVAMEMEDFLKLIAEDGRP